MKRTAISVLLRTAVLRLLSCLALIATVAVTAPANAAPRVVATIAPVHSLVAAIMDGIAEPHLLLPGDVSPHDFALRPSDARALAGADLVVWVGESLETFLPGVLSTSGAPALELMEASGVEPVAYEGGAGDQHGDGGLPGDGGHDHAGLDPHVWLDPVRAQAMAAAIAGRLAEIDPENADRYLASAEQLSARLAELNRAIAQRLAGVGRRPFVTFHEGFGYFVRRYGLSEAFGLTLDPQRRPGARTMSVLRQRVREQGITCAFAEPQFDDRTVRRLAEETGIRLGRLDPLGAGVAPGPDLYFEMMQANAAAMAACLSDGRAPIERGN